MSSSSKPLTRNFVRQIAVSFVAIPLCLGASLSAPNAAAQSVSGSASQSQQAMEIERLLQIRSMMENAGNNQAANQNPASQYAARSQSSVPQQSQFSGEVQQSAALSTLLNSNLGTNSGRAGASNRGSQAGVYRSGTVLPQYSSAGSRQQARVGASGWTQPMPFPAGLAGGTQYSGSQTAGSAGNPLRGNSSASQVYPNSVQQGYVQPATYVDDANSNTSESVIDLIGSGMPAPSGRTAEAPANVTANSGSQVLELQGPGFGASANSIPSRRDFSGVGQLQDAELDLEDANGYSSMETRVEVYAGESADQTTNEIQDGRTPRTLPVESRSAARALPATASSRSHRDFHRSLTDAVSSPNLAEDLNTSTSEYSRASEISAAELERLKAHVGSASTRTYALDESGSLPGSSSNPDTSPIRLVARQLKQEADTDEAAKVSADGFAELESLIDDVKENVESRAKQASVPAFQPYAGAGQRVAVASESTGFRDAESLEFDRPWLELSTFDYAKFRAYLHNQQLRNGPSVGLQIAETEYFLLRRQYDRAADILAATDSTNLSADQMWLRSWQQAQLAIGTQQPQLLRAAVEQMGTLENSPQTLPFLTYCEAHLAGLQQPAEYSQCVKMLEKCIEENQKVLTSDVGPLRNMLLNLKVQAHVDMGRQILAGPFRNSVDVAQRWFDATEQVIENLGLPTVLEKQAKTELLLQQIEGKARAAKITGLQVDYAFLQTQIAQLKTELAAEDSRWLDWRFAEVNYDCAVASYQNNDGKSASKYLDIAKVMQGATGAGGNSSQVWQQYFQSRCSWLEGALADSQNRPANAVDAYERFMQTIPNHLTTRVNSDQGNQAERLGSVAVALWKKGERERAVQIAQASVAQMYSAIEQGFAANQRIERLEQNLALMQDQLQNPVAVQSSTEVRAAAMTRAQTGAGVSGNQRINAESVSHRLSQGAGSPHRSDLPVKGMDPSQANIQKSQGAASVSNQQSSGADSNQPVKSFFKGLFSSQRSSAAQPSQQ